MEGLVLSPSKALTIKCFFDLYQSLKKILNVILQLLQRWLRQAMDEGSSDTAGMVSPVPGPSSGGMSPNPLACMQSPGESSAVGKSFDLM